MSDRRTIDARMMALLDSVTGVRVAVENWQVQLRAYRDSRVFVKEWRLAGDYTSANEMARDAVESLRVARRQVREADDKYRAAYRGVHQQLR